ncbi:MAG: hypothetical protein IJU76_06495 [Desulfovibrionaceae bacterium]|nr:hypothetical protein [Desulfovibrionaceae bacterium]
MDNRQYDKLWLLTISASLIAVGGFQSEMEIGLRIIAVVISFLVYLAGRSL